MRQLVEQAFGWDEYSQDAAFARKFALSDVRIVTLAGKDIRWIQLQADDRRMNLCQFYIVPECQGRGIGGAVLAASRRFRKAQAGRHLVGHERQPCARLLSAPRFPRER